MLNYKHILPVLTLLFSVVLGTCDGPGTVEVGPRTGTIELLSINMHRRKPAEEGPGPDGYEGRLQNIVAGVQQRFLRENRSWSYIGLSEAYYQPSNQAGSYKHHDPVPIPCFKTSNYSMTANCFDAYLRDMSSPPDFTDQHGDAAFIANHEQLLIEGPIRKERLQGYDIAGLGELTGIAEPLEYALIGARFRILNSAGEATDYSIPIYTVHIPTKCEAFLRVRFCSPNRMSQLKSMIAAIKSFWNESDKDAGALTPIVLGDFNFRHQADEDDSDPEMGRRMRQYFIESDMVLGGGSVVDGIWVGKESEFPGAAGTMVFSDPDRYVWTEFDDFHGGPETLTDHPVVYARLHPLTWAFKETFGNAPSRARSNDGPTLLASGNTLYLSWSGRGDNEDIFIMASPLGNPNDFGHKWKIFRPNQSDPISSAHSPALAKFEDRLYIAWLAKGNHVHVMSTSEPISSERSWTNHVRFSNESDRAPALLATDERLFLAWKERDGERIFIMDSADGINWSAKHDVGVRTDGSPALALFKGKLFISWIGSANQHIFVMSSADGGHSWTNKVKLEHASSYAGPALLSVHAGQRVLLRLRQAPQDRLYLMWTSEDIIPELDPAPFHSPTYLQIMTSPDGIDWSHTKRVIDESSDFSPSLAYFNDRFVVAWTGRDNERHVNLKGSHPGGDISIDVDR